MARANTPLDPLERITGLEEGHSIPVHNRPWFTIGQLVRGVEEGAHSYYLGLHLKQHGKRRTREILDFLQNAESLEYSIAGIHAHYALPTMMICNQCYLQNGQSHSGLTWEYKVLIKGILNGSHVCCIPDIWVAEGSFIPFYEPTFEAKCFYRDHRNCVYKCLIREEGPVFVYVGHIRPDGRLSWDNHITPRHIGFWGRRTFQPYTLPERESIVY